MAIYEVVPDADAVARATADHLIAAGRNAIERRGRFMVALSGGTTPLTVCPLLVIPPRVRMLDWTLVQFFFADERAVGPDDADSNYRTVREALLDFLPKVTMEQVHRMRGEADDLDEAAHEYEEELRSSFEIGPDGGVPRFDLIWLGMGADGHTASLFPGSDALSERRRWVRANWAPGLEAWRLTLTFPVLDAAREAMFVATGAEKAEAVAAIRTGTSDLPAGRVEAARTRWILDDAAAGSTPR